MNFRFLSTLRSRLLPGSGSKAGKSVGRVLQAFLNASTMEEKRAMLHAHPELLGSKAEELLRYNAVHEANQLQRPRWEQHRQLLELCRRLGIDAAFTPVPATPPGTPIGLVFQAFANTPTLEQKKALLKTHPELLGSECAELLRRSSDEQTGKALEKYSRLFELCRKLGIDAAFAQAERQARNPDDGDIIQHLVRVVEARSLAEMEATIREEPRVVERDSRESLKTFVAVAGNDMTGEWIRLILAVLEACDRNGIAATFASLHHAAANAPAVWLPGEVKVSLAPDAEQNQAFDGLIRKFEAGHSLAALAIEAKTLIPDLPILPRRACMVLAMICSSRAGDAITARRWAVRLNAQARDGGVAGVPSRSLGPVVVESRDFEPIVETLHWLARSGQGTPQEQEAIRSLILHYAAEKKKLSGPDKQGP